ncbi:HD-GYP domain-containing protein, partial [Candidatus Omnitrophota bacterium]
EAQKRIMELDETVRMHSLRSCVVSDWIAVELGLSFGDRKELFEASFFHDIGKAKPEVKNIVATEDNFPVGDPRRATIEGHSQIGRQKLTECGIFSDRVLNAVLSVHRRYDGSGYPENLGRHNIPYFSRIIAIADALDAMTDEARNYKLHMTLNEAMNDLRKQAGMQFDPDIVEEVITLLEEKLEAKTEEEIFIEIKEEAGKLEKRLGLMEKSQAGSNGQKAGLTFLKVVIAFMLPFLGFLLLFAAPSEAQTLIDNVANNANSFIFSPQGILTILGMLVGMVWLPSEKAHSVEKIRIKDKDYDINEVLDNASFKGHVGQCLLFGFKDTVLAIDLIALDEDSAYNSLVKKMDFFKQPGVNLQPKLIPWPFPVDLKSHEIGMEVWERMRDKLKEIGFETERVVSIEGVNSETEIRIIGYPTKIDYPDKAIINILSAKDLKGLSDEELLELAVVDAIKSKEVTNKIDHASIKERLKGAENPSRFILDLEKLKNNLKNKYTEAIAQLLEQDKYRDKYRFEFIWSLANRFYSEAGIDRYEDFIKLMADSIRCVESEDVKGQIKDKLLVMVSKSMIDKNYAYEMIDAAKKHKETEITEDVWNKDKDETVAGDEQPIEGELPKTDVGEEAGKEAVDTSEDENISLEREENIDVSAGEQAMAEKKRKIEDGRNALLLKRMLKVGPDKSTMPKTQDPIVRPGIMELRKAIVDLDRMFASKRSRKPFINESFPRKGWIRRKPPKTKRTGKIVFYGLTGGTFFILPEAISMYFPAISMSPLLVLGLHIVGVISLGGFLLANIHGIRGPNDISPDGSNGSPEVDPLASVQLYRFITAEDTEGLVNRISSLNDTQLLSIQRMQDPMILGNIGAFFGAVLAGEIKSAELKEAERKKIENILKRIERITTVTPIKKTEPATLFADALKKASDALDRTKDEEGKTLVESPVMIFLGTLVSAVSIIYFYPYISDLVSQIVYLITWPWDWHNYLPMLGLGAVAGLVYDSASQPAEKGLKKALIKTDLIKAMAWLTEQTKEEISDIFTKGEITLDDLDDKKMPLWKVLDIIFDNFEVCDYSDQDSSHIIIVFNRKVKKIQWPIVWRWGRTKKSRIANIMETKKIQWPIALRGIFCEKWPVLIIEKEPSLWRASYILNKGLYRWSQDRQTRLKQKYTSLTGYKLTDADYVEFKTSRSSIRKWKKTNILPSLAIGIGATALFALGFASAPLAKGLGVAKAVATPLELGLSLPTLIGIGVAALVVVGLVGLSWLYFSKWRTKSSSRLKDEDSNRYLDRLRYTIAKLFRKPASIAFAS